MKGKGLTWGKEEKYPTKEKGNNRKGGGSLGTFEARWSKTSWIIEQRAGLERREGHTTFN